jgi:ParB family chromosome partitioning protein
LALAEPKYTIEQIASRTGKSATFIAARLKLTELTPAVVESFYREEIGVGHALLLAKLQPAQQVEALAACFQEQYANASKAKRILLPVRQLQQWIEHNILLQLAAAPFSKDDAALLPEAGACVTCPKRTGHNVLLFDGIAEHDSCSDPKCHQAKLDQFVKQSIAAKPKMVQISTAYGTPKNGSPAVPRNQYVEIRTDKPANQKQRDWPEYKTCKFTTEAIVTEGSERGETKRVCANPDCPIHHARKAKPANDAEFKAEQEKRRREEAIAHATGLRLLKAIGEAVPIRLAKRDLLFAVERFLPATDERRLSILLRQHNVGKPNGSGDSPVKLLTSFLHKADETTLGRILVKLAILQKVHSPADSGNALREAAEYYKVDVAAVRATVKQEFAAKEKAKAAKKPTTKPAAKSTKKAVA